jgi:tripartite-type tricarboxylate transporter receptor subunit TctC
MVPYLGGTTQALNDVIIGRVPMVIDACPPLAGALQAGAIRALAIGSTKRLSDFPDLPTVAETLPSFSPGGWLALVAPVGTPHAIVRKLSDDLRDAVLDPTTRTKLETTGNYPNPMSPSELLAFIQAELRGSPCWKRSRAIPWDATRRLPQWVHQRISRAAISSIRFVSGTMTEYRMT